MHDQLELQATQHIIKLFENSKLQSEEALDSLPGIYAVIDGRGQILKGNKALAQILEISYENLIGLNLRGLFAEADWQTFCAALSEPAEPRSQNHELTLDITDKQGQVKNYLWYVRPLVIGGGKAHFLYSIIGHDVTDLRRATESNARMQFELDTAKTVQSSFFPAPGATFGRSSISGYSETATECGGDWWHYKRLNDKIYLCVGDVTGHGVTAALVVSAVHAIMAIVAEDELTPTETLELVNRAVGSAAGDQRIMTFLAVCIDLKTNECVYASAGHEPMILLPHGKAELTLADLKILQGEPSAPLGSEKACHHPEAKIRLNRGDRLVLYTDGVYDIVNPSGTAWTIARFRRTLMQLASQTQTADSMAKGVRLKMDGYRQGAELKDDATFCIFQL